MCRSNILVIQSWSAYDSNHGSARLSPSDLRTTLPDLRALAKRSLASPHRAEDWRRSVDDQPRACPQHRRARLSLQASAREGLAETQGGLGQAAQNDAGPGGAG